MEAGTSLCCGWKLQSLNCTTSTPRPQESTRLPRACWVSSTPRWCCWPFSYCDSQGKNWAQLRSFRSSRDFLRSCWCNPNITLYLIWKKGIQSLFTWIQTQKFKNLMNHFRKWSIKTDLLRGLNFAHLSNQSKKGHAVVLVPTPLTPHAVQSPK